MGLHTGLFYLLAAAVVAATVLAITRRHLVHAVIYLIVSFFGSALIYYLLGAPYLAALEIIVYAGAIMVLFLFIVMMLHQEGPQEVWRPWSQWLPALVIGGLYGSVALLLMRSDGEMQARLQVATVTPRQFGRFLFQHYWFAVELAAVLLLVVLVGILYLGKRRPQADESS